MNWNNKKSWIELVWAAAAAGIGLNALFSWAVAFFPLLAEFTKGYEAVRESQYAVSILQGVFLYAIMAPIVEELIFRGCVYRLLERFSSWKVAAVGSALLFGLYHGNVVQFCYGFLMGLLLAYVYHCFSKILAPMLFHSMANLSVFLLSYGGFGVTGWPLLVLGVVGTTFALFLLYSMQKIRNKET